MPNDTLLARLAVLYPQAKKTTLREMVTQKRVRINGTIVRTVNHPITEIDKLEVAETSETPMKATILAGGLTVVYFDADIIIVNKPAGLLTSTDAQEKRPTAWRILQDYVRNQTHKNQIHLIHRLDRDASGVLVFARAWDAYSSLKKQFFEHTITRQYSVVVHGIPKPPKAKLEHLLIEGEFTGTVRVTPDIKKGKLAILDYETIEPSKLRRLALLKCTLFTGRKHQIRIQLKAAGHAVCGDPVYGIADEPPHRLALHATRLVF